MMLNIDLEVTNRCNATCNFCPRDQTPHEGLMSPEVFDASLAHAVTLRDHGRAILDAEMLITLCGLGEPLINKHTPSWVKRVRDQDIKCGMSSNAALLNEKRGSELLEAGLQQININISDLDDEYERIYDLPFERTRDNIVAFAEMAKGTCEVHIVLVNHRDDPDHVNRMKDYWRGFGIDDFIVFGIMNRGGALEVDHMQYEQFEEYAHAIRTLAERPEQTLCAAPFWSMFVGYDGEHYLCCSDWRKEAPLGSVFDNNFTDVMTAKLELVESRNLVCKGCNLDPVNQLTETLQAVNAGELDQSDLNRVLGGFKGGTDLVLGMTSKLRDAGVDLGPGLTRRPSIPLTIE